MKISITNFTLFIASIFFLLGITTITKAQTTYKTELTNIKLLEEKETEKVHLHFDRQIFSPGEDIWFKAYLLEGTYHTLTSTSNNLHVDLISPNGVLKKSMVVLINNGVGYGDIHLDRLDISEGTYQIRAYTNFMRNFGEDFFFTQNIIVKESNAEEKLVAKENSNIDLQFFPEGGNLVQNVINRVAFKAIDERGKGKAISITIYDNKDKEVVHTTAVHKGMGNFQFIPKPNVTYHAIINSTGYENKKIALPKAKIGYSIFVGNQYKELLDFKICTSPENVNGQQIFYIIQSRGKLYAFNKIRINETEKSIRIEKEKLPEGISSITVYNQNGIPVCERLVFNQIYQKVNVEVKADKKNYKPREKVTLTVQTKSVTGNPIPANLSLTVIEKAFAQTQNSLLNKNAGIVPSVLLNADLKGNIENPEFYFENFDYKKHFYLDLVLLTHGWRKYIWKEKINSDSFEMDFAYENGFTIIGTSKTLTLKRPIANSKVTLVMSEDGFYYDETISDENGRFMFENTHLMDGTNVVFQAYTKKDKRNTIIELDEFIYELPLASPVEQSYQYQTNKTLTNIAVQSEKIVYLKDSIAAKNHHTLEEITVKGNRIEQDGNFRMYTRADEIIEVGDDYDGYPNIIEIIREQVPTSTILGYCPLVKVYIRGNPRLDNNNEADVVFLLDGMIVNVDQICSVPPAIVDKIEVLSGPKAVYAGSAKGAISIFLKKGDVRWSYTPVGITKDKQSGYYRSREFYTPNYDLPQEQFAGADYRNTLYWAPFVTTDKNGKAEVSFFNSDISAKYEIQVEGVGFSGGIGQTKSSFEVDVEKLSDY